MKKSWESEKEIPIEWRDPLEAYKYVCDGAKIQCMFCASPGTLKATSTKVKLQDKPFATEGDKDGKVNFNFQGPCMHPSQQKPNAPPPPCKSIISLGKWMNVSKTFIGNDHALLAGSMITCSISGSPIRIIHSGQKATLDNLFKMDSPAMKMYSEEKEPIEKASEASSKLLVTSETDKTTIKSKPLFHGRFCPLPTYEGEFGFDWMRDNTYPAHKADYASISENFSMLESEYEIINIAVEDKDAKYYVPWLNMFPDNKKVTDKDVELIFSVNPCNGTQIYDFEDDDYVEFVSPGGNLKVTPDKVSGLDLYNGLNIKINCINPLTSNDYIEAIYRSKALTTDGEVVGKINVLKNDKTYYADIYVVTNYIKPIETAATVTSQIESLGGIKGIEDYLNKHSLNQALIQVKLHTSFEGQGLEWPFSNETLQSVSNGTNPNAANPKDENEHYIYKRYFKGMLDNSTNKVNQAMFVRYINFRFGEQFPRLMKEKCVLLYLTTLKSNNARGSAAMLPTRNKHCIIFKTTTPSLAVYSHEIGHIFGLTHSFLEKDSQGNPIPVPEEKNETIANATNAYNIYQKSLSGSRDYFERYKEQKRFINQLRINAQGMKEDAPALYANNLIRFKERSTDNIMDYSSKRLFFSRKQWETMQNEVKQFHGKVL